jgi:hypothetical protein
MDPRIQPQSQISTAGKVVGDEGAEGLHVLGQRRPPAAEQSVLSALEAFMSESPAKTTPRRILTGTVFGVAALTALAAAPARAVSSDPAQQQAAGQQATAATTQRTVSTLDGFAIEHLPCGIGSPSDFEYEWEDVVFHSRVWETGPDDEGATKVDLMVKTLRGEGLTDLQALRTFLTEYHEKDPAEWQLTAVQVGAYSGYSADDQLFFFVSPGVAAEVTIDRSRFSETDLTETAQGFHPEQTSNE